jgi:hypothetical protein
VVYFLIFCTTVSRSCHQHLRRSFVMLWLVLICVELKGWVSNLCYL